MFPSGIPVISSRDNWIATHGWSGYQLESPLLRYRFLCALSARQRANAVICGLADKTGDRNRVNISRFVLLPVLAFPAETALVGNTFVCHLFPSRFERLGSSVLDPVFLE